MIGCGARRPAAIAEFLRRIEFFVDHWVHGSKVNFIPSMKSARTRVIVLAMISGHAPRTIP